MNIWFLIWVFLATFILGIFLWSMQILMRQKTTWRKFAEKHKLQYEPQALMRAAIVRGTFQGFPLRLYSEEQPTRDQRGQRFRTVIQIELPGGMPTEGVVASNENTAFAEGLIDLTESFPVAYPGWHNGIVFRTKSIAALQPFMTDERYKSLLSVMSLKTLSGLFIFDTTSTFLRIETPDPLHDLAKLERMCSKLIDQARILSLR